MQAKKNKHAIMKYLEERKKPTVYDIEYNMDEVDREILLFLNQKYSWADENMYELVMDRLEKEHHYLQRIAITKITENEELSEECNICGEKETENDNFLVFCDGCNIAVHQSCYGVPNIPDGSWLCRPCLLSPKKVISCILCPISGGAYKRTSNGFWCHVLCGHLVTGARFENTSLVEPVDIEDVHRSQQQCLECGFKKGGVAPCAYYGCRRYYHATCAVQSKKYIDLSNYIIFCHEHDPQKKAESVLTRSPDGNYPLLEHTPSIRNAVPLWIPQRRIHSEIESVAIKISDYVVNRIVNRDMKNISKDSCDFVKDMFTAWQARKKDRPIIKRLRIDAVSEGFKDWGKVETVEREFGKEERAILDKYALPSEIILPKSELHLYEIAVLGAYKVQKSLETVRRHASEINKRIAGLENERIKIFSKYIPRYQHIKSLFDDLERTDRHDLFREIVTDDIAPGYSSVIHNPISLETIQDSINGLKYKSFDQMVKDVELLISNAYKYNGQESFIGIEAHRLEEVLAVWKMQTGDTVLARILPDPYLPYVITASEVEAVKDGIKIEDKVTGEIHLIERKRAIKPKDNQTIINALQELNKEAGVTQEQEEKQKKYINAVTQ
ncbi:bromodomain and PHD finger-containing protein 1 [Nematocida minor]|uniref:bromodomain and PHD finger-containing protein 1 n=1 Tax=Nematocida minor TaxID=1912983 RepID=UPI00221F253F|nr:bromodomain and PHD finger-containing protein 1 [Nematocida minor]KAI5192373.1 bromodomain and PHD finger-containing protein 1 [Nematocida minor]